MSSTTKRLAGGILLSLLAVGTLLLYVTYVRTSCWRADSGVVCVEQRVLLGGYPIGSKTTIKGIHGVVLDRDCSDSGGSQSCSWYLHLRTRAGTVRASDSFNQPTGEAARDAVEAVLAGRSEQVEFDNYNAVMVVLGLIFVNGPFFLLGAGLLRTAIREIKAAAKASEPAATTKQTAQPVKLPPPRVGE